VLIGLLSGLGPHCSGRFTAATVSLSRNRSRYSGIALAIARLSCIFNIFPTIYNLYIIIIIHTFHSHQWMK
ncbi:hypothetical protein HAX54_036015, partial [Datura stramonium]|nr:hypothetical protein [Datura stramonium]